MTESPLDRRQFLAAAAAATAFTIVRPQHVRGTQANSKISIGLIGCGGRGTWIANLFNQSGHYQLVAAHDYFQDRVDNVGTKYDVPAEARFTGLSGYKRVLESRLDAAVIISPPYFHPEQVAAAVDAGKHVYLAKPIAVDVPGCISVEASARRAREKKLSFLVDFQTRANEHYREVAKRVQSGECGKIAFAQAFYHAGRLGVQGKPDGSPESRLRNWVFDKAFSGDIITEQNIHALDVATWLLDAAPVSATGAGGRKVRTDVGDCWDHFVCTFTFPDDVVLDFSSNQFSFFDDICARAFGSKGMADTHYSGEVSIRGQNPFKASTSGLYQTGTVVNVNDFAAAIRGGDAENPTVAPSLRSNLTTILGRTAAYEKRPVTWDEMIKSNQKVDAKLEGLKG